MPSDLDTLIDDVLAKHAAVTGRMPFCALDFCGEKSVRMITGSDSGQIILMTNDNGIGEFTIAAANAAAALARRLKLSLEALEHLTRSNHGYEPDGCAGCALARNALAPEEPANDAR